MRKVSGRKFEVQLNVMNGFALLLAPLALLLPAPAAQVDEGGVNPVKMSDEGDRFGTDAPAWGAVREILFDQVQNQVRIERRVVIRIAPRSSSARSAIAAEQSQVPTTPRYFERPMGRCIKADEIAAVQAVAGNRLMLHMHDRSVVSAKLETACRARDFYSGFYVEPSDDGMICVSRERLHARTGASCQLSRMRQLVAITD